MTNIRNRKYSMLAIFVSFALLISAVWFIEPVNAEGTEIGFKELGPLGDTYFLVTIWDLPDDHDLEDDTYDGWCIQKYVTITHNTEYDGVLYHSYDDTDYFPSSWDDVDMNKVNYLINNRDGYEMMEIQHVMWYLFGWSYGGNDQDIIDLIDEVDDVEVFVPEEGDLIAWLIEADDTQNVLIEVLIPEELDEETAWAQGSSDTELWDIPVTDKKGDIVPLTDKWGWYFEYAEGDGDITHVSKDLYAGAGQNDISKGTYVGTVEVWDSLGTLYVTYNVEEGVNLLEAHIFADEDLPETAAPGQFPYSSETDFEFEIDDLPSGWESLFIAVHGVVTIEPEEEE